MAAKKAGKRRTTVCLLHCLHGTLTPAPPHGIFFAFSRVVATDCELSGCAGGRPGGAAFGGRQRRGRSAHGPGAAGGGRAASEQGCTPLSRSPRASLSRRWKRPRAGKCRRGGAQAAERGPGFPRPSCRHLWKVKRAVPVPPRRCLVPPRSRRLPVLPRRLHSDTIRPRPGPPPLQGNAGERESIGAEQPLEVPEPSPPCPQGRRCPPPAADRSVLESGRRVPAGCRVLGGHRALTSARWAVRFLSHRFPGVLILTSPKPQASLPGPLPLPYLLDAVQNGIRQPSLRFTFSLTLCAARVAQQILKPEEHVYIRVKRFLLSHRYLDLRKVPGFLQLFYSFDFEYKTARVDPQISWGRAA
ncbi:serine/arginine repetitive matrix protein 1-like [Vidua chalybeata]|uniref:serine/arginine repetitive matrix protein 1-like n=1 Tax=Vidua chalybeata TaxID=81927 RepID=UPI0023A8BDE0|nr:serine/arginine repetitive matrix protein 1-like [Vidua chalybeata]